MFEGTHALRYAAYMLGVLGHRVQKMNGVHTMAAKCIEIYCPPICRSTAITPAFRPPGWRPRRKR